MLASDNNNTVLSEVRKDGRESKVYTAYGHSATVGSIGFNGELCDKQTGWYLLGNGYRAYNPWLMRFHSPDSLSPFGKGGVNAYAFVQGDPVNFTDPTGHWKLAGLLMFFMNVSDDVATGSSKAVANVSRVASTAKDMPITATVTRSSRSIMRQARGRSPTPPPDYSPPPPSSRSITLARNARPETHVPVKSSEDAFNRAVQQVEKHGPVRPKVDSTAGHSKVEAAPTKRSSTRAPEPLPKTRQQIADEKWLRERKMAEIRKLGKK